LDFEGQQGGVLQLAKRPLVGVRNERDLTRAKDLPGALVEGQLRADLDLLDQGAAVDQALVQA
jgi:hypothetical protein